MTAAELAYEATSGLLLVAAWVAGTRIKEALR